jgi:uncharacterized repeat protein (TIGR02543 family)
MPVHAANVVTNDAANKITVSGDKAGGAVKFLLSGKNMQQYFKSINTGDSADMPAVGTEAYIPIKAVSNYADSADIVFDYEYDGPDTYNYERYIYKAADFTETAYFAKYTVIDARSEQDIAANAPVTYAWSKSSDTYVKTLNYTLKGLVVLYAYPAKNNSEKWVKNGSKIPKYTPKKKGWKFKGWYTDSVSGKKIKPGTTKVSFGNSYSKYYYAHWDKKISVVFNANGGKIGTNKKTTKKVNFRAKYGKLPVPTRKGYVYLGWHKVVSGTVYTYPLTKTDRLYDIKKVTYKALWIKKGKGGSVTTKEWNRFADNQKYGLTYQNIKAIFGGPGRNLGYGYIICSGQTYYGDRYEWDGNGGGTVQFIFNSTTHKWSAWLMQSFYTT